MFLMIVFVVRILEMHNHKADYIKQVTPFYNVAYLLYPLMDDAQGKFKGGFGVDVLIADLYEQSIRNDSRKVDHEYIS